MQQFKEGDLVSWESQARGYTTVKCGTVIKIIPKEMHPDSLIHKYMASHSLKYGAGISRRHESYLVEVPHPGNGKPAIYWPVVSKLQKQK